MSEKNKKVLILIQYLSPGGIEWMVAHLAQGLHVNHTWQPYVFVYDDNGIEPIDSFFTQKNIRFQRVQKSSGFSIKIIVKLFQLVRSEKISVIHVHHLGALMMASFVKLLSQFLGFKSIKIVYTQHSFIHLIRFPRYRSFEKIFCWFAEQITAVSEQVQNEFKSYGITKRPVVLIPNGSFFPKKSLVNRAEIELERTSLLTSEGIEAPPRVDEFWILYLGRIHAGKGQDLALKVWSSLPPVVRAKTNLIFIGPVTDKAYGLKLQELISLSPQAEKIFCIQSTLQASRWMQVSNLFMSSSESEGWPMAVLEALGSGTPALLSNIPGHQMYRSWAQYYDLKNPVLAGEKIESFRNEQNASEKFTLFRQNRWSETESLRLQFSIEKMVLNFEKIYEGLFN